MGEALAESTRPVVFCDCEGYESTLLNLDQVPALRDAAMLVELHEGKVPQLLEILQNRFAATHKIEIVAFRERRIDDLLPGVQVPQSFADAAMRNARIDSGRWMFMIPMTAIH